MHKGYKKLLFNFCTNLQGKQKKESCFKKRTKNNRKKTHITNTPSPQKKPNKQNQTLNK